MFFGAPLTICCSFDNVFKDLSMFESLYHQFVLYYDHVEGDVEASLALFNSYLSRKCAVAETKLINSVTTSGNLFTSKKFVEFCNRFNQDKHGGADAAEELDDVDLDRLDVEKLSEGVGEDAARSLGKTQSSPTKISKKMRYPLMGKDILEIGWTLLSEKDIVAILAKAKRRSEKKSSVRECIMKSINDMVNGFLFKMSSHGMALPTWQKYVRGKPNNLGIH